MEDQGCLACTRCRKRPLATNGREFRNLILVENGDSVVQCWRSLSQSTNTDGTNRQTRRGIRRNAPITSVDGLRASCRRTGRPLRTHWRPDRESNPGARICSPLRHHSAIGPRCSGGAQLLGFVASVNRRLQGRRGGIVTTTASAPRPAGHRRAASPHRPSRRDAAMPMRWPQARRVRRSSRE